MSGPEVQALAALRGVSVQVAAVAKGRDALNRQAESRGVSGGLFGQAWRRMAPELRQVLIALGTDRRDTEAAAALPWAQLSADERIAVGALARDWRRQLETAGWLR